MAETSGSNSSGGGGGSNSNQKDSSSGVPWGDIGSAALTLGSAGLYSGSSGSDSGRDSAAKGLDRSQKRRLDLYNDFLNSNINKRRGLNFANQEAYSLNTGKPTPGTPAAFGARQAAGGSAKIRALAGAQPAPGQGQSNIERTLALNNALETGVTPPQQQRPDYQAIGNEAKDARLEEYDRFKINDVIAFGQIMGNTLEAVVSGLNDKGLYKDNQTVIENIGGAVNGLVESGDIGQFFMDLINSKG